MRKIKEYLITDEKSRDFDKLFIIEEMPAIQAEKWCYKALSAMIKAGLNLPAGMDASHDPVGFITKLGLAALLNMNFDDLEPLLDEIMGCIKFRPNKSDPLQDRKFNLHGPLVNDIQEVSTLVALRQEAFDLHLDFLLAVAIPIINLYFKSDGSV